MTTTFWRRTLTATLVVALIASPLSATAAAATLAFAGDTFEEVTIRCESTRGRYRYCRADTEDRARLERDYSNGRCQLWRTWGYDRRGVWVDDNCRGEFRVGKDGGPGAGTVAAVGAVAGVAILGAILASKNKSNEHPSEVAPPPSWAVGTFRGYDPAFNALVEITIASDGRVSGRAGDERFDAKVSRDHLHIGPNVFELDRIDGGFKATRTDDKNNIVYYHKVG